VTKKEIASQIATQLGTTHQDALRIIQETLDSIIETLLETGRVELRNFGVFEVKHRASRKARNPKTGEVVDAKEKHVVTFKPGKVMEEKVVAPAKKKKKAGSRVLKTV